MTEKQLELLEFEKQIILDEESDNGYEYHFYAKIVSGITFLSCSNDETTDGEWFVHIIDTPTKFTHFGILQALFNILEKAANEE